VDGIRGFVPGCWCHPLVKRCSLKHRAVKTYGGSSGTNPRTLNPSNGERAFGARRERTAPGSFVPASISVAGIDQLLATRLSAPHVLSVVACLTALSVGQQLRSRTFRLLVRCRGT
jgi:hypothetical protein